MSHKQMLVLAIVVALAVGGWFLWHWWKAYQAQGGGNLALGTNLNSVAPELVGGSSGPQVQPAVSLPVNITLTEQVASAQPPAATFSPLNAIPSNPLSNPESMGAAPDSPGMMTEDTANDTPLVKQATAKRSEKKTDHRKTRRTDRRDR